MIYFHYLCSPNYKLSVMDNCRQEIDFLFETSWEVCNKVGGIYTVLSTKAKTLKSQFGDNLIFIGPDVWTDENPSPYFTEVPSLMRNWAKDALLPECVDVRTGRWNIPGRPIAILVKFNGMYASKDEAYGRMWELYHVDSLHAYGDYDEGCAFARAAAAVIESIVEWSKTDRRHVVAHFDEWTTAMGLLTIKADMPEIATVFTTHATSIGRSICGNGKPLYDQLENYNGDQMAEQLNMQSKHSLEKAAAHQADCFTTVSDVTAREASQLLEKTPDVVTPNGFELNFVPARNKYKAARKIAREKMFEVVGALTGLDFSGSDDIFFVATSGRCEYRNKGIDMYLDALNGLGSADLKSPVVAFVMVPAWCAGPRSDLQAAMEVHEISRLADPLLTHNLHNYNEDPVNRRIHEIGFANDTASKVTVIYVPCYLDGSDGIFNLTYYELLPGFDATVFPSYYEPWGYTPLESVAFGVPTITTDLAGFGMWVEETGKPGFATSGVEVEHRTDSNYSDAVAHIVADLKHLVETSTEDIRKYRKKASDTAARAQWSDFISFYDTAFCMALRHRDKRIN